MIQDQFLLEEDCVYCRELRAVMLFRISREEEGRPVCSMCGFELLDRWGDDASLVELF